VAVLPSGGSAANITISGNIFRVHTYAIAGTSTFNTGSYSIPNVEVLIVAGGGDSGLGGGGGGGVFYTNAATLTASTSYTVIVGTGGAPRGGNTAVVGGSINYLAIGGGSGATNPIGANGNPGGSGGGGSGGSNPGGGFTGAGGTALQPGIGGFGSPGGGGSSAPGLPNNLGNGGGGGASSGGGGGFYGGGGGGAGILFSISGTPTYYGGGGGAQNAQPSVGAGAAGIGGGPGAIGGGGQAPGGAGGTGIAIIRYNFSAIAYVAVETLVNNPSLTISKYITESVYYVPVSGLYGTLPYTYSISPTLPTGLSFNTGTGAVTGIPAATTPETTYTVEVTDSTSANAASSFTLETTGSYIGVVDIVTNRRFTINSTWISPVSSRSAPIKSCTAIISTSLNTTVKQGERVLVVSTFNQFNNVKDRYKNQTFEKSYPIIIEETNVTSYGSWGDIVIPVTADTNSANVLYDTPGTYTWTVPADVTSISAIAIGAGGGGVQRTSGGAGGAGGNLAYVNTVTVTPGSEYTIVVGQGGAPGATLGGYGGNTTMTLSTATTPILLATGGNGGGTSALGVRDIGTFSSRGGFGGAGGANGGGGGGAAGWSRVNYRNVNYHTFTANGTFTITSGTGTVQYLVVGGGGGGGEVVGGGGGGGNVLQGNVSLTVGSFIVTVGNGGAGASTNNSATYYGGGSSGNLSSIVGTGINITAQGGGGGGGYDRAGVQVPGSGGGPGGGTSASTGAGVTAGTGSFSGGGSGNNGNSAGGGAGAGFPGFTATNGFPGRGGFGNVSAITGQRLFYGGGGGGGARNPAGGAAGMGGFGGGGAGAGNTGIVEQSQAQPGVDYTGGGGGGGGYNNLGFRTAGGNGGKGVVIVKYYTDQITATGGAINTYIETRPFHSNTVTVPFVTGSWGGNGAAGATSSAGFQSNGGGGGGGGTSLTTAVGGGGGTGILDFGANGAGGSAGSGGGGGSGGASGTITGNGGAYGGGGSGAAVSSVDTTRGWGGDGALRIIFPGTRVYPVPAYPYPANFANLATRSQAGTLANTNPIYRVEIQPAHNKDVTAISVENSSITNFNKLNNILYGADQKITVVDALVKEFTSAPITIPVYKKDMTMVLTQTDSTNANITAITEVTNDYRTDPRLISVQIANYIIGSTGSSEAVVATSLVQVWM
jgi:hypothetical protein